MPEIPFELNSRPRIEVRRPGTEQWPIVVIDNAMRNPEALVEFAATRVVFGQARYGYYPGVRAPLPKLYVNNVCAAIAPLVRDVFGIEGNLMHPGDIQGFALTTTRPEQLMVEQRCAHADTYNPNQLAVLHYLCRPEHRGTSFYRHRATGFETLDENRAHILLAALQREWHEFGVPPARYLDVDDRHFERIESVESVFDRIVIYRGKQLHAPDIDPAVSLGADPRRDRLTATFFPVYR
jgi:hypothetical protein